MKILHRQDMDPRTLEAFRGEIDIMSKIYHPNIVLFMGACTQPGSMAIITELLKCDVESLLKRGPIPLRRRMRMARDAALGMTWLHLMTPAIIHRDLKAGNLLIDENDTVKICDFGLSVIKPKGKDYLRDGVDGAKGTPLWMAPEVMQGETFNEKADVYSFGIVLWEILEQKEPFEEFDNFEDFRQAVCVRHERPKIPESCLPRLRNLIEASWHREPDRRPTFPKIVEELELVLIESAISDVSGCEFWRSTFKKDEPIPWRLFLPKFQAFLKGSGAPPAAPSGPEQKLPAEVTDAMLERASERQLEEYSRRDQTAFQRVLQETSRRRANPLDDQREKMFYFLLVPEALGTSPYDPESRLTVKVDRFGDILEWFGPIFQDGASRTFIERVTSICAQQWFHGDLATHASETLLAPKPVGTYLVRFSSTTPGCYTISKVSAERSIAHHRVIHSPGHSFHVNGVRYPSLEEVIIRGSRDLGLLRACAGSVLYNELFTQQRSSGYVSLEGVCE